jgi:acetylornithine/succinyldiaminopimelate/putrescine aminotransferase
VAGAEGAYFWDHDGNRYLDFSSGLVYTNIGYQHPHVVAAIQEQAGKLATFAPAFAIDVRSEAARLIAERTPGELDKIFFTNGGAEAVENAVRMARLHTGRPKLLSAYRSYHGATATAIHLTGDPRRWPSDSGTSGVVHFWAPFLYRSPFHSQDPAQECERALAHLEDTIAFEGPGTIAAIILETVPGTAGIMVPPPGYLAGVREICDRYGIVFILDEVMAGFGRTGTWFAAEHFGVVPDLLTFAKGVNSGYVPLGGVAISPEIAETFATRPYPGGLTYSGHPLACAAAIATIRVMGEEGARLGHLGGGLARPDRLGHRPAGHRRPAARGAQRLRTRRLVLDGHRRVAGPGRAPLRRPVHLGTPGPDPRPPRPAPSRHRPWPPRRHRRRAGRERWRHRLDLLLHPPPGASRPPHRRPRRGPPHHRRASHLRPGRPDRPRPAPSARPMSMGLGGARSDTVTERGPHRAQRDVTTTAKR